MMRPTTPSHVQRYSDPAMTGRHAGDLSRQLGGASGLPHHYEPVHCQVQIMRGDPLCV